jgi:hypothetical protein
MVMDTGKSFVNIKKCVSCGKDHWNIPAVKLDAPVKVHSNFFSHATVCPTSVVIIYVAKDDCHENI